MQWSSPHRFEHYELCAEAASPVIVREWALLLQRPKWMELPALVQDSASEGLQAARRCRSTLREEAEPQAEVPEGVLAWEQ